MVNTTSVVCPPGFDCQAYSTCPSYILPCPDGFFCSSYEGSPYQSDLDFEYAYFANQFENDVTITNSNKEKYVVANRTIQNSCLQGFYCPNATTILPCPSGHWCPPNTVKPHKCDVLSVCSERAKYQLNFVNFLIMSILGVITFSLSSFLRRKQAKAEVIARKRDPNVRLIQDEKSHVEQAISEFKQGYIEIIFDDLHLQYSKNAKVVLPNISGMIPAGQISAILGPTSSGKSSLLNILRLGYTDDLVSKGNIKVRVRNISTNHSWTLDKSLVRNFVGYVPQDDIFDRDLTVRELLTFNALTRLQGNRSSFEIKRIVDEALADLGIQHAGDSIIGGGENKAANISGGQLKRVNIGCELVSLQRPGILLLDEPTNGLDASVAYELMETLEVVRDRGITIVMVIQQPRAEIFAKIQHLFLMNSCGGIVYEGSSGGAVPYLRSIGYNVGEETSDADFCVDVLNGLNDLVVESVDGDEQEKKILDANKLHLIWSDPDNRSSNVVSSRNESALEAGDSSVMESVQYRNSDSPFFQSALSTLQKEAYFTYLNSKRLLRVRLRDQFGIVLYVIINAVMASALSSGFSILITGNYLKVFTPSTNQQFYDFFPRVVGKWNERPQMVMSISQLLFFLSSALGAGSCLASVPVFAGKAIILARERSGGMSVLAYSLGRILADLFFVIFNAFVFAGIW